MGMFSMQLNNFLVSNLDNDEYLQAQNFLNKNSKPFIKISKISFFASKLNAIFSQPDTAGEFSLIPDQ